MEKQVNWTDEYNEIITDKRNSNLLRIATGKSNYSPRKSADRYEMEDFYQKRSKILTKMYIGSPKDESSGESLSLENFHYTIIVQNPERADPSIFLPIEEIKIMYKGCFLSTMSNASYRSKLSRHSELEAFLSACQNVQIANSESSTNTNGAYKDKIPLPDYLEVVRNVILVKLAGCLGLRVKQLVSTCGKYIFFIIHAKDSCIKREAEFTKYQKELDLSFVDLHSLEPCDEKLRPFIQLNLSDSRTHSMQDNLLKALDETVHDRELLYAPSNVTPGQIHTYYMYVKILLKKIGILKALNPSNDEFKITLKKAMTLALNKANKLYPKHKLKSLWDRLQISKPSGPFMKYTDSQDLRWRTFKINSKGKRSQFNNMEKIRLLYTYMHHHIALYELKERGLVVQHFPLHCYYQLNNKSNLERKSVIAESASDLLVNALNHLDSDMKSDKLISSWRISLWNMKIPLAKIKNYFGEKIGLYFEFLRVFQRALLLPSAVGTIALVFEFIFSHSDRFLLIMHTLYSIFIVIWGVSFLEYWKKREKNLSILWGQTAYKEMEINRPQFHGFDVRDPITDDMESKYFPFIKKLRRFFQSFLVTFMLLLLVIASFSGIVLLRWVTTETLRYRTVDFAAVICAFLNAIMIQIFNFFYGKINKSLTDHENHKTQTSYDTSLILKTHIFQFFNSFGPLMYIAFFKSSTEGCIVWNGSSIDEKTVGASCLGELYLYLFAIFVVNYLSNIIEIGLPMLKYRWKLREKRKIALELGSDALPMNTEEIRKEIEKNMMEDHYLNGEDDGTIGDYLELVELFGSISLFAVALPIASLLSFIGLWMEMHADKFKLLHLVKRPVPLGANRIGIWWNILDFINFLSVFTNVGVICFTEYGFKNWEYAQENIFLVYGLIVCAVLLLLIIVKYVITSDDNKYQIMKKRHDIIVERLILKQNSEDFLDETIFFKDIDYSVMGKAYSS